MKLSIKGEHDFTFETENPDESLKAYWRGKLRDAIVAETEAFLEEVAVEMRRLQLGSTVTIESRPIKVTLSKGAES